MTKQQNLFYKFQGFGACTVWAAVFLLSSSLLLAGCENASEPRNDSTEQPPETTDSAEDLAVPPPLPDAIANPDGASKSDAELPDTVKNSVFEAIAATHNTSVEDIQLDGARTESWPDGCLGLGGPDEICTFAIVEGWEVTASQGKNLWVYRTSADGALTREVNVPATESF